MIATRTLQPMSKSLRVLSLLLTYPDDSVRKHLTAMKEVLRNECTLTPARRVELNALIDSLARVEPLEAEAHYVELFDRGRATSLHLFEHVHGDSRDRGPAMIDLGQMYAKAGLMLTDGELPDYLPAVLEFVSTQPAREARAFLSEMAHILNAIFAALIARESAYASVLGALLELAGEKATVVTPTADDPLDQSWSEPAAFDGCSTKGQARPDQVSPVHIIRKKPAAQRGVH